MTQQKTIGILGGLGPLATVEFMRRIMALTPIAAEEDHLHLIVDCNPKVPSINNAALTGGTEPLPHLVAGLQRLEQAGADLLVMVCNAAHMFEPQLRTAANIPFISMVESTAQMLVETYPKLECVGVLATDGCLEARIYQRELARRGIHAVQLDGAHLAAFMAAIARIKAGQLDSPSKQMLLASIASLTEAGAQAIILGCSEVGLLVSQGDCEPPLLDPTECLAAATVRAALAPS